MRKFLSVSKVVISILIMILSMVFIFIEGRLIISGDFMIYDNAFNGFIRYLFRLALAVLSFVYSLYELINIKRKDEKISEYLMYGSLSLVVMSIVVLIFSTNYVGIVLLSLAGLNLLNKYLLFKVK